MLNRLPTPSNPYYHLTAMHNREMFYGRLQLRRRFYSAIANRQSVSLVGPRHIGKSSLMLSVKSPEMQQPFEVDLSRHIFVYLDLRAYLHKTCEDFFHLVSKEIMRQSRGVPGLNLQAEGKGEDEFSLILEQVVEQDFFPVLLLDAFDNIIFNEHFDHDFFAYLRAQVSIGKVSYVTATMVPLYEGHHRGIAGSPFFNIFQTYTLGPLDHEEAQELVSLPAKKAGLPFTKAETGWILRMAGRHPFFIQRVCYSLFEEKLVQNGDQIDQRLVRKLAYDDLKPHFADTWERLSEADRAMLQDEAQQPDKHHRGLSELSESVLFRQYVRRTCRAELFEMTTGDLENALENLDDAGVLGQTDLRLMNLITRRLKKDEPLSVIEKGIAIREVLNEALEKLRGSSVRNDTDSSWQNYNILYYRYKYHLKNEQIAARIGISPRQYFRYRNKAIETLLNVLFEMENTLDMDE